MLDLFAYLNLKPSVVQGTAAGALISFVLSNGETKWPVRAFRAAAGATFALVGTEGFLELARNYVTTSPATERLGGLVFGLIGIYLAEALVRVATKIRDRSDRIAGRIIKFGEGRDA